MTKRRKKKVSKKGANNHKKTHTHTHTSIKPIRFYPTLIINDCRSIDQDFLPRFLLLLPLPRKRKKKGDRK